MRRYLNSLTRYKHKLIFSYGLINIKSFSIHVDKKDDVFFKQIKDWWDPDGSMKTLHYYNDLRIKYILEKFNKQGLTGLNFPQKEKENDVLLNTENTLAQKLPFNKLKFLDIGCGGGLFCESIARLGGNIVGIDSNENSYNIAATHLETYEGNEYKNLKNKITYFHGSVDNYKLALINNPEKKRHPKQFDVVTAFEVIEHVNSPRIFIEDLSPLVKDGGYLLLSTINKTNISYLTTILLAERLLGIIPNGTHVWNKFLSHEELSKILKANGYLINNISGVSYNPLTHYMGLSSLLSINYILIAQKIA